MNKYSTVIQPWEDPDFIEADDKTIVHQFQELKDQFPDEDDVQIVQRRLDDCPCAAADVSLVAILSEN